MTCGDGEAALGNRVNVLRVIDSYIAFLQKLRDGIDTGDNKSVIEFLEDAVKARDRWLNERTNGDWQTMEQAQPETQSFGDKLGRMFLGNMMDRNKKKK